MNEIKINSVCISEDQIGAEMQYHPAESQDEAAFLAAKALAVKELLLQEAQEQGLFKDFDHLDPASNELIALSENAIKILLDQEVAYPEATEAECQTYYESNKSKFVTSALLEVSHILIGSDPDDADERKKSESVATNLITQLTNKLDKFSRFAKDYSSCPSKEVGGNLGQLTKGQTTPEFERQVFTLKQGLCLNPVESRYGFHIVNIERRIEGNQLPFDQVHERIQDYLNQRVEHKAISQYIHQLASDADIEGIDIDADGSPLMQ